MKNQIASIIPRVCFHYCNKESVLFSISTAAAVLLSSTLGALQLAWPAVFASLSNKVAFFQLVLSESNRH